jgi:undecaprenyl pyrophosphate phosphatase UppP
VKCTTGRPSNSNQEIKMHWIFGFGFVGIIIAVITTIFWIWMLIDCLQNRRIQGVEKLIWVLVILFLHVLGAVLYFAIGREQSAV